VTIKDWVMGVPGMVMMSFDDDDDDDDDVM